MISVFDLAGVRDLILPHANEPVVVEPVPASYGAFHENIVMLRIVGYRARQYVLLPSSEAQVVANVEALRHQIRRWPHREGE